MRAIWKSCDLIIEVTHYNGMYLYMSSTFFGQKQKMPLTPCLKKKKKLTLSKAENVP